MRELSRRHLIPTCVALAFLAAACFVAIFTSLSAMAHHPGSHAWRQAGTDQVKFEAVATATQNCISIGSVTSGAPAGQLAPDDAFAVTIRLGNTDDNQPCKAQAKVLKNLSTITVPISVRRLHIFIVDAKSILQATERLPIN